MDKLSELIPEFYYDLIARVTPGAVLCATLAWSVHQRVPIDKLDPVIGLPLALLVSYLAGFLLDSVSAMTLGRIAGHIFEKLGTRFPVWRIDVWKHINEATANSDRAKLTKMMAERAMARSLVALIGGMWLFSLGPVSNFAVLANVGLLLVLIACWVQAEYNSRLPARDGG
jgi:hypothetical protein